MSNDKLDKLLNDFSHHKRDYNDMIYNLDEENIPSLGDIKKNVALVVSDGEVNSAAIIMAINGDQSSIKINADKVMIDGNLIVNALSGSETSIDGGIIRTGSITGDKIDTDTLIVSELSSNDAYSEFVASIDGADGSFTINYRNGVSGIFKVKIDDYSVGNRFFSDISFSGKKITLNDDEIVEEEIPFLKFKNDSSRLELIADKLKLDAQEIDIPSYLVLGQSTTPTVKLYGDYDFSQANVILKTSNITYV